MEEDAFVEDETAVGIGLIVADVFLDVGVLVVVYADTFVA